MAVMCETCKCSIYLETQTDGTRAYGGCENECVCCNGSDILEVLQTRNEQVIALTEEIREELEGSEDVGAANPILFAEQGPNRFRMMSLFFEDVAGGHNDGVKIQEDLDLGEITITYFTDEDETELTEGAVYDWALNFYKTN
jgi:hypothetical protein